MRVPVRVVPGPDVDVVGADAEDVGGHLRRDRLVPLALRDRAERQDDLAEDVELDRRHLVVPGELQVGIEQLRLAEVVRARIERRADPQAEQLPARLGLAPALLDPVVADQVERDVQAARVVAGVVDASVRRLVRHLVRADVVPLAHLDRVEPELRRDDVHDPLGQPQVLHARVPAVRPDRRLVRHHLREVDADVPPAIEARRDLRPDDAPERLVAREGAAVVERAHLEAEHRPVGLDRHLDVEERPLVSVRVRHVLVGSPLRPLDRAVELPREQAAGGQLRMEADLVAEAAADVVRDEAELVEAAAQRRPHPDRADARHLVVAEDRPLPGRLLVLDERARALERRGREAVEVEPFDADDLVGLRERRVVVAPVEQARPDDVRAGLLVQERRIVLDRALGVDQHGQRLVLDLDQIGGVARDLARGGDDGRDRLAHVPHLADRERVVLHVRARGSRELEERVGQDRDLVAGQRPVDAAELERLRDVDALDLRVRVRRAHEVEEAHPVPLEVVEEDALALDEAPVLLARDALARPAALGLGLLDDERPLERRHHGGTHGSPVTSFRKNLGSPCPLARQPRLSPGRARLCLRGSHARSSAHHAASPLLLDRLDDVHVPGAAADVPLDRLPISLAGLGLESSRYLADISIPGVQ